MKPLPGGHAREPAHPAASPEIKAGLLSSLTFSWLTPMLKEGAKAPLTKDQVPELPPGDRVDNVARDFERCGEDVAASLVCLFALVACCCCVQVLA